MEIGRQVRLLGPWARHLTGLPSDLAKWGHRPWGRFSTLFAII